MKMKHWVKQLEANEMPAASPGPAVSDISVQRLIDDSLLALHREIKNILILSAKGKLDAPTARDLRDHLKVLFEIRDRESESLRGLTDEQLQEQASIILSKENPPGDDK